MRRKVAIVLSGGGARAAYQAGVLRAIAEWRGPRTASPVRHRHRHVGRRDQCAGDRRRRAGFRRLRPAPPQSVEQSLRARHLPHGRDAASRARAPAGSCRSSRRGATAGRRACSTTRPSRRFSKRAVPIAERCRRARQRRARRARDHRDELPQRDVRDVLPGARRRSSCGQRSQRVGVRATLGVSHLLAIERDSVRVSARRHRRRLLRRRHRCGRSRRQARRCTWAPTASWSWASGAPRVRPDAPPSTAPPVDGADRRPGARAASSPTRSAPISRRCAS